MTDPTVDTRISALPDPEFVARLEWQVRTAARRRERFARPVTTTIRSAARIVPAIVLAMGLGASGLLAAQEYVRERAADVLGRQYEVRFEIARMREAAALEDVQELVRAVEQGLASAEESYAAEERRIGLAIESSLLGLDAIEVGTTGHDPDRRLNASRVADRDLVTERLQIELSQHRFRVSGTREREKLVLQRLATGVATETEVDAVRARLAQLEGREQVLLANLDLRRRFLAGGLPAEEVELRGLREEALVAVADAEHALLRAQSELERAETLHSSGFLGERELKIARRRPEECAKELELARLELQLLDSRLSTPR